MAVVTVIALACRLLLAAVFVVSAVSKLRDAAGARQAIEDFGLPRPLVRPIAAALPIVELGLGVLLVVADPAATLGAVGSLLLLSAFTATIVLNLLRGRQVDCHCFGRLSGGPAGWRTVTRNAVLLLLAAVPLRDAGGMPSLPAAADDYTAAELGTTAVLVVMSACIVVLALLLQTLVRRYGGVLLRLEALESHVGLAAPAPAPSFALPDLDDELVALTDVLAAGRPALIAFISPTCHLCGELIPDLERWQTDPDEPMSVVVISTGNVRDNRDKIGVGSQLRVLLQDIQVTETAWGVTGTPAAVFVSADGALVGTPAYGIEPIRTMHDNVVTNLALANGLDAHQIQPRPVSAGDVIAEMTVTVEGHEPSTLVSATEDERLLVFWRFDCGFCEQILDDLRRLEAESRVVLVTGSTTAAIRDSGLSSPILREDGTLTAALQVPGTPSAVTVRAGVVTSAVAVGGPDVLALIERSREPTAARA
jgi:thiol-disulfide isomerase/thioredoxin